MARTRHRPALAGFLLPLAALVAGCAPEQNGDETFSVVLLLAGPENDGGWNQAAYEGLQLVRERLGARTRKITARTRSEIEFALTRAAEEGADLVIGHGFEFNEPAAQAARAWPEVAFVTMGGLHSSANLATVVLRLEEAAFQLGVLAAHATETGTLSAISGAEFEPVRRVPGRLQDQTDRAQLMSVHGQERA